MMEVTKILNSLMADIDQKSFDLEYDGEFVELQKLIEAALKAAYVAGYKKGTENA